jgi:hypothetical protein
MAEERARVFGSSLEAPDEIRRLKRVAKLADELAGGQYLTLMICDPGEAKRIRTSAEEKLKTEATTEL